MRAMVGSQLQSGGAQPARVVVRGCLANVVTDGARVCAACTRMLFAATLRAEIMSVASCILGSGFFGEQMEQLFVRMGARWDG